MCEDWLFHALLPLAAYVALAASACAALSHARQALFVVAAAALLLLFIGIHNAWDAVTYHVFVRTTGATGNRASRQAKGIVMRVGILGSGLAEVVSAFNNIPSEVLFGVFEARGRATRPSMVYCGDNQTAKTLAATLIRDMGFKPIDAGLLRIA